MADNFLPYSLPDIGDDEIACVKETISSGWLTSGPKTSEFEKLFQSFIAPDVNAIALNSATAGLHLALEAIGVNAGDEIITTTHTFTATAEVIRYLKAIPVFVDINSSDLCIAPLAINNAITKKTKAIIPVHFGGHPAQMKEILSIAKKHKIMVIEDAAHALPCRYEGNIIGSLKSNITVFSFYANKTMTTGEGGMLVTRDKEIAKRVKIMRLHGINKDVYNRFRANKVNWKYDIVAPGYKYNLTDIASSLGIIQLQKIYEMQEKREKIASIYNTLLKDLPIILPKQSKSTTLHSWHLYVIQLLPEIDMGRDIFIDRMFSLGIGCSVHYIPLHLHTYWKKSLGLKKEMFPISQKVYERSVSLPIYSKMTSTQAYKVVESIKNILS